MVDWISLAVPFAYLGVLIGSLATFSHLYRARKAAKAASLAPWFGPHLGRNIYLSLLHMEPAEGKPKVPDSVLKAALMRRAVEDIHRLVEVRNAKQALQSLLQKGSVGDDLWQRFQRAEKEIEAELRDVVQEVCRFGCQRKCTNADNPGQRLFFRLGPNHLPERLGNRPEPAPAAARRRAASAGLDRKGVVGQEARYHPGRLHEGARRRQPDKEQRRRRRACRGWGTGSNRGTAATAAAAEAKESG
ncbi:Pre protein translocase subunit Sec66-domain-containing protein [Phyllosticta capitalensis]